MKPLAKEGLLIKDIVCEDIHETVDTSLEDDEILKEILEEEKRKREQIEKEKKEARKARKGKNKKKKSTDEL